MRTREGRIVTGVNIDAYIGRIAVCAEAIAIGRAITETGDKGIETIRGFLTVKGSRFTASMLHYLEKGAMVEADHIVGDMIARAKKAGISTPNLRMAYAHLQVYLARRARAG